MSKGEKFYYGRVSSKDQNLQRQEEEAKNLGIDNRYKFFDKESGKQMNRKEWDRMFGMLRDGDILYVNSLDRISRNYNDLQEIFRKILAMNVDIVVLNNSLLDTTKNKDLLGTLIFDLTISLLSYVAETERINTKERQRVGIELTLKKKKDGLANYGRPKVKLPMDFKDNIILIEKGLMTHTEYRKTLGMPKSTYFKYVNAIRNNN